MKVPASSKADRGIAVVTGASSGIGKVYAGIFGFPHPAFLNKRGEFK
jgi:hypothetical protein